MFQSDETFLGIMVPEMNRLMKKFLTKFIKMSVIKEAEDLSKVDYKNREFFHNRSNIAVGMAARSEIFAEELDDYTLDRYFTAVENFYVSVTSKMFAKFPYEDKILQDLTFLNPVRAADTIEKSAISRLAERFSVVEMENYDQLDDEIADFQLSESELPEYVKEDIIKDGKIIKKKTRVDEWWHLVINKKTVLGVQRFPLLSKVLQAILTIPNSNSESERVFSMVGKVHTNYRSQMANDTLCALLATKLNTEEECFSCTPTQDLLKRAKKATSSYVQDHNYHK